MVLAAAGVVISWLPNERLAGDTVIGKTPDPDKATDCGLLLASSVKVIDPVRLPSAAGENTTVIVQLVLAATVLPQLLLAIVKSPVMPALETFSPTSW